MRLRYARPTQEGQVPNFGDLLNPIIFEALLPGYFETSYEEVDFLGIGTTLGMAFPEGGPTNTTIVFSSGLGGDSEGAYGRTPEVNEFFDFACVRGPLTARALDLPDTTVVTDGALLLNSLDRKETLATASTPVFVPHMSSIGGDGRWHEVAAEAGLRMVNPCTADALSVVDQIRSAPLVLAEAMHGAIVADTFGVPWVPIVTNSTINRFKWTDWCLSMGLDYDPVRLPPLLGPAASAAAISGKLPTNTPRLVAAVARGAYGALGEPATFRVAIAKLRRAAAGQPKLSDPNLRTSKLDQLYERLADVRKRYPL